ncbi:hypothetical protein F442_21975 [Phytophthora nicotianae P10297]|uniref:Uncharacterized protein n=1 Tax=Phytophthora nicotianae P10297 TaxID=1317064 RepID=W2Y1B0_PHYNI|nr:hypothetical protein F442_21975 [Phytophthora nicotianae P10297]
MSTPLLSIPYIRIKFAEASVLTYTNPKPWRCMKISDCSYWHLTKTIYWNIISSKYYAVFYESDSCDPNEDDEFYFVSDRGDSVGDYTFKKGRVLRSMALGQYKDEEEFTHVNNCPSDTENAVLNETSIFVTWGSDDRPNSLMSNWTDALPC